VKNIATVKKLFSKGSPWPSKVSHARILICFAVLAAYASVWRNEFVYDDLLLIVQNVFLRHWNTLPQLLTSLNYAGNGHAEGFYRPVQMLLYFLIYQAFGLSTVAFHALNVALQALNACLLHHFGLRAGFKKGVAFAAALLWALHPLHTIDVAYMASTAELLWSCFCLLGLITLLPDFTPHKIWRAMVFFVLALGCKESAVVFPALAAITFFFTNKERTRFSAYVKIWPLWLLSVCYIVIWLLFRHLHGSSIDISGVPLYTDHVVNRILTSLATLPAYTMLMILPLQLHINRVFPLFTTLLIWPPMVGVVMVALSLLQIFFGRARRGLALSFGLLWFAVALSPVTGIVVPVDTVFNEGWVYVPSMGLFLGVAQTASGFFEKRKNAARVMMAVLAVALGTATFLQNRVWRNTESLYFNIVNYGGHGDVLSNTLGLSYLQQGKFDQAAEQFQDALDYAERHHKTEWLADIHLRLAMAWLGVSMNEGENVSTGDVIAALPGNKHIAEAVGELGQVLQNNPDFYWAHQALAAIYRYQHNDQMADFHDRQAKEILQKQANPGR